MKLLDHRFFYLKLSDGKMVAVTTAGAFQAAAGLSESSTTISFLPHLPPQLSYPSITIVLLLTVICSLLSAFHSPMPLACMANLRNWSRHEYACRSASVVLGKVLWHTLTGQITSGNLDTKFKVIMGSL